MQGIVKSSFQAQANALQKAKNADAVKRGLEKRSSLEQLQQKGVAKKGAPSTQPQAEALKRAHAVDQLNQKMSRRTSLDELQKRGIVPMSN